LTFGCFRRQPFLSRERTCGYLADAIVAAKEKCQFDLWAYVFMPEHVHLLICPRQESYSISRILTAIKQPVARRAMIYLREYRPDGLRLLATGQRGTPYRFWRAGGGYDRNITEVRTVVLVVRYIHANPVRRGLVAHPSEWCYSSAKDWEEGVSGRIPIDFDTFPKS
jgi:putative transposase